MMRYVLIGGVLALAGLSAAGAPAGDAFKSGPQVGSSPTPFDPLHVTGDSAGEKSCLV